MGALAVLFAGLSTENLYSQPQTRQERISQTFFLLAANATIYQRPALDKAGSYYLVVYSDNESGTVFSSAVSEESLQKWLMGQYNASWDGTSNGSGMFGLLNRYKIHYAEVENGSAPKIQNIVFWNPEKYTQQVHLDVFRQWSEVDVASQTLGVEVAALGAVGIAVIAAFVGVKNRAQLRRTKITGRKVFALVASVLILAGGIYLWHTYSNPVEGQNTLEHGTVTVPPNDYKSIDYQISAEGTYIIQLNVDRGTIQAFHSGDGTPFAHWGNGTTFDERTFTPPVFNASSGLTGGCYGGDFKPYTEYLLLSNVDSYSKQVQYEVDYRWSYSNYFAMMAGIALAAFGAITLVLTLFRDRLRNFNRALENQQ